jgi:uncharacterized protein (TIGR02246 family)
MICEVERFSTTTGDLTMRLSMKCVVLASLMALDIALPATTRAEDNDAAKREAAAIRAAAAQYVAALAAGDADALRRMWSDDGDYIDATGRAFKAREIIAQLPGDGAPDKRPSIAASSESTLRFITDDVVVEDGAMVGSAAEDSEAAMGRFTAVWVKRDGRWRLDSLREAINVAPAEDPLQALDWLIGEWAGKADGSTILVSSRRSNDGHFIVREFVERHPSGSATHGTQHISWDASTGKFKCWTFDSLGGSGEGIWQQDGNRWVVETIALSSDGRKSTSKSTYIPGADGRFVWETADTKVGDANVPGRRVQFKRAAEKR